MPRTEVFGYRCKVRALAIFSLLLTAWTLRAIQPGDLIINEIYFAPSAKEKNDFYAVELLVVKDKLNLNGLQVSDRPYWNIAANDQCTLQDLGRGFLNAVPSGTLVVIYNGTGEDDIDPSDFTLRFYAQSSLFCNIAPTGHAFRFAPAGRCLHVLHLNQQVDFVKYKASNAKHRSIADPGNLTWENGVNGQIEIGKIGDNTGFHFLGNKPPLNDYPAAWMAYAKDESTLGEPNGGANTTWINELRGKRQAK